MHVRAAAVENYEQDMIEGVLDLQRAQVQQVMTPRVELIAIAAESSLTDLLKISLQYKYSRVPVYNGSRLAPLLCGHVHTHLGRGHGAWCMGMGIGIAALA